jgi:hypothetical protein
MILRILSIPLILTSLAVFSSAQSIATYTVDIEHEGTYQTLSPATRLDETASPTGKHIIYSEIKFISESRTIKASLGTSFGIEYRFIEPSDSPEVPHTIIWRFPEPGLTNPVTGKTMHIYSRDKVGEVGKAYSTGWFFVEPWELVPGPWILEVHAGGKILSTTTFDVQVN